jgi:hypothetical protein
MLRNLLPFVAAVSLAACATGSPSPAAPDTRRNDGTLRVQGQLTAEGVECQAFRADDGTLYTLLGDLKGLKAGERVVVEGTRVEISFCMQGITLQVKQIERRP